MKHQCWVLARVDITAPIPMVVSVETYNEPKPPIDPNKYCWWELCRGESRSSYEEARAKVVGSMPVRGFKWASKYLNGSIRIPPTGR